MSAENSFKNLRFDSICQELMLRRQNEVRRIALLRLARIGRRFFASANGVLTPIAYRIVPSLAPAHQRLAVGGEAVDCCEGVAQAHNFPKSNKVGAIALLSAIWQ